MTRRAIRSLPAVAGLLSLALAGCAREAAPPATTSAAHHDAPHWSYQGEGGPAHWGALSPEFLTCDTGTAGSPVDLGHATRADLPNIAFSYQPSAINVVNNGHTIQADYDPGSFITIDGTRYDLVQFHFHAPSEHLVGGRPFDAELHLVHRSADGRLAVVGVLLDKGPENAALKPLWDSLPATEGPVRHLAGTVNAAALLPATRTTFRYDGSLTTPPCTEGVKWNVMTAPIHLSAAQLSAFTRIIHGNNRPVQPRGARALIEDTSP